MAPPLKPFPLSELPERSQEHTLKRKSEVRKPRIDFETCDLYELIQYSCVTKETLPEAGVGKSSSATLFARLFRRCGEGDKIYHVETTAWEGEHAYELAITNDAKTVTADLKTTKADMGNEKMTMFGNWGMNVWSKK